MFLKAELRETLRSRGNKTQCFPQGQSLKLMFCYTSQLKSSKKCEKTVKNCLLYAGWLINLLQFQGAQPDHVRVESSSCCFPRELESFLRPGEFFSP